MAERNTTHKLTETAWPVFEFLINFARQVKHGNVPAPEQVRFEALTAIRDAEDIAREDPASERLWNDPDKGTKAMLVYLIDYKMLNTVWAGQSFWFDSRFETDPEVLNHVESLGGDKFFEACDELQKEYETAERRDRRDKDELAEMLNLYFVALRLGFKGRYHDRPQELAEYTRRLYSRLPAYAHTRSKEMFPEAYENVAEVRVDYRLGVSLGIVAAIMLSVIVMSLIVFRLAWSSAVKDIELAAEKVEAGEYFAGPQAANTEIAESSDDNDESDEDDESDESDD
ncbi:MAG TPA: DotU family type IV/VI secretion system protein [Phycisphaerae bacterium]|nr:DotU family type IV/VI secretion system protein [Phycisphaerae bacterium]